MATKPVTYVEVIILNRSPSGYPPAYEVWGKGSTRVVFNELLGTFTQFNVAETFAEAVRRREES